MITPHSGKLLLIGQGYASPPTEGEEGWVCPAVGGVMRFDELQVG